MHVLKGDYKIWYNLNTGCQTRYLMPCYNCRWESN